MSEPMTGAAGVTLTQAVEDLAEVVEGLRSDLSRRTRRLWRWVAGVAAAGVVALVFVLVSLFQAVAQQAEAQRAACAFWQDLGSYPTTELQTEFGQVLVADARVAAEDLDCP